jgi:hypothetical protein
MQAVCYVEAPEEDMRYWQTGPCLTDIGVGDDYALMPVRGTGLKFGSGSHRRRFGADINDGYEVIAPFSPYLRHASAFNFPQAIAVAGLTVNLVCALAPARRSFAPRPSFGRPGSISLVSACD